MDITNSIWELLIETKRNTLVFNKYLIQEQKFQRIVKIALGITSTGSIAAWGLWKDFPTVWAIIIGMSQLLTVVTSYIKTELLIKELHSKQLEMNLLNQQVAKLWRQITLGQLNQIELESYYEEYQQKFINLNQFSLEVAFEPSQSVTDAANLELENYALLFQPQTQNP